MALSRREFSERLIGSSVMLLALQACGGGGSYSSPATPTPSPAPSPASTCSSSGAQISGNHGHEVTIPLADLDSMTDMTYNIQGTATHNHTITLTVAMLQQLKNTDTTSVNSTVTQSHNHMVTISCV
jgi:hypothetical protein